MNIHPSQQFKIRHGSVRHRSGVHVIVTEAQTLDQALEIIKHRETNKQRSATHEREESLGRQISIAKFVAANKSVTLSTGVVKSKNRLKHESTQRPKIPHPFRDLPEAQKPDRARQMLASRNFGIGAVAGREIARLFGVSNELMAVWLGIEIWSADQFNGKMRLKNCPV